ncbi:MAG: ASCH domain-containing protein [Myxococcota bacterium]|nr:ASCH domain-containing protein [Myxococcota bacterium]
MAARTARRVALLAIHPPYAEAILAGTKRVEFRKRRLAADIEVVLLYATQPVGGIVGAFRVAGQVESSPAAMWRRFRDVAGIGPAAFGAYFDSSSSAVGIMIGNVKRLSSPLPLPAAVGPGTKPPQSVFYLTPAQPGPLTSVIRAARRP